MNEITPIQEFQRGLAAHEKQFKSVLPAHIPAAKFMRTVVGAVQNNPKILGCDRQSLYLACQKAAQDGLIFDGREAALVQFKDQAQYMPMVAGLLKKLRQSGQLSTITAQTVHKNDAFSFNPARDDIPQHEPDWFGDRGEMVGVYAVARMKDGGYVVEIMNMAQINKVKGVSRTSNFGPWKDWPEEMAKKTVLRRLCKLLPSSADIDLMLDHDNEMYDLGGHEEPAPKQETKTRAAEIIEAEYDSFTEVNPPPVEDDDSPI